MNAALRPPLILPLGDRHLLVRFGDSLDDAANRAAIAFGRQVDDAQLAGVAEIAPNLISVLLRYDPTATSFDRLAGEVRLLLSVPPADAAPPTRHRIPVQFSGPDLATAAASLSLTPEAFIAVHNAALLRVLATGFAPGFVYCGFHPDRLVVPRRGEVHPPVPAGSVLFAAGQTAIASTPIPTGWHIIGTTHFRNFDPAADPPTRLAAGDEVQFEAIP